LPSCPAERRVTLMQKILMLAAVLVVAACSNRTETESSGTIDTTPADTTVRVSVPDIDLGTTTDTVNVPTLGTQKDTIIVDKPVVTGRKPVEVKRPTVDVRKP
jgi:hypothetical protein